jgi:hypothetical protein
VALPVPPPSSIPTGHTTKPTPSAPPPLPNPVVPKTQLTEQTMSVRAPLSPPLFSHGSPFVFFFFFFVEFALEIGSGLLTEVRRLQSLLAERDKALQDMKKDKDDLEKTLESLRTGLRVQEQNTG